MKEIPQEVGFTRDDLRKVGALCASFTQTRKIETFREAAELLQKMGKTVGLNLHSCVNVKEMWRGLRILRRILLMKELGLQIGLNVIVNGISGEVTGMTYNYYVQVRLKREKKQYVNVLPESIRLPGLLQCKTCLAVFPLCIPSSPDQAFGCSVEVGEKNGRILAIGHYGSLKFDGVEIDLTNSASIPRTGINCDTCIERSLSKGGKILSALF